MKKKLIGLVLAIVMLSTIPLAMSEPIIQETAITNDEGEPTSIIGVTFIAGYIFNPQKVANKVRARTLALGYYYRGLIVKDTGVAILKNVYFKDSGLLYMSQPNSLGMCMVVGLCSGFRVVGM